MTQEELNELFKLPPNEALRVQLKQAWTPEQVAWFWPKYRYYHPKVAEPAAPQAKPADVTDVRIHVADVLSLFSGSKEV